MKIALLEKANRMVVRNPKIKGGEPVVRGTRIPVSQLVVMANSMTAEEILEGYPTLTPEQVELARVYGEAYPKQGKPRRRAI